MRNAIFFEPNSKPVPPERPFAVFDIEAAPLYPGEPLNTCFLGAGIYDGETYIEIDEHQGVERLLAELLSERYKGFSIYAHNGSGYDFIFLLESIVRQSMPFRAHKTGGRFFLTLEGRDFLDSMVVLRGSLDSAAESLQVKTRKMKDLPDDFYQEIRKYWQPLGRDYMRTDVFCLYECIATLRAACRELGCNLKNTLASTAMDLFQRRYLSRPIRTMPWWHSSEIFARAAYVGGRCEIFKALMAEGASWDINSSYPFAMLSPVPTDFEYIGVGSHIPDTGLVYGTFEVPKEVFAPPLHLRTGDKLYFPTGKIEGWYTSEEARYCIEKFGTKSVKIGKFVVYKPDAIFADYVRDLYEKRKAAKLQNNAALAEACKYLMNTIYGKTGTNRVRQQIVCGSEYYHYPFNDPKAMRALEKHRGWRNLNKQSLLCYEYSREHFIYGIPRFIDYGPYIMPQIAAWITAKGRLALQGYLDQVGDKAVYCDTDSIYAELPGEFFPSSKELGGLKLESRIAKARFALPKCYEKEVIGNNGERSIVAAAKGLARDNIDSALRFIAGEGVQVKRVLGAVESLRRFGQIKPRSELQNKKISGNVTQKRHPDGRAFSVTELSRMGIYGLHSAARIS